MRKILFLFLVVSVVFFACSKEKSTTTTTTTQTISASALPANVVTYINNYYPDATIYQAIKITNATATYLVTLSTEEDLAFNNNGQFLGDGTRYWDLIPDRDSLCPGPGGRGHHGHHGGHPGGHHHPPNWIPPDSLSAGIKAYISANYSGYTIIHAEKDSICPAGAVTEVMVAIDTLPPVKLVFDLSDNFLMKGERVHYANIPQVVKDYITANYSEYTVCGKSEKFTLADISINYAVHLRLNRLHKRVIMKEDGTFVCEQ